MNILAFDTSSAYCSVALKANGNIYTRRDDTNLSHSKYILEFINAVLDEAKIDISSLDAISLTCGPGSFTGIRIGIAIAQGLGFGKDIKTIPISSLALVASSTKKQLSKNNQNFSYVLATIDARMNEIYGGWYDLTTLTPRLIGKEWVLPPNKLPKINSKDFFVLNNFDLKSYINDYQYLGKNPGIIINGTGLEYRDDFPKEYIEFININNDGFKVDATDLIPLSEEALNKNMTIEAEDLRPIYIRDNVTS